MFGPGQLARLDQQLRLNADAPDIVNQRRTAHVGDVLFGQARGTGRCCSDPRDTAGMARHVRRSEVAKVGNGAQCRVDVRSGKRDRIARFGIERRLCQIGVFQARKEMPGVVGQECGQRRVELIA